ncbi:hypothetical protein [Novosphingobium sp. M1R2S20]|uniref:Uncharacterized protein n=1 Tax=Novosphingobium rhizovicinum TaxID=3228928 RepID=A0ABV3RED3_9SPHN
MEDNLGAVNVQLGDENMAQRDVATAIPPTYATFQWIEPGVRIARLGRSATLTVRLRGIATAL